MAAFGLYNGMRKDSDRKRGNGMDYQEARDYICSIQSGAAIKPGLETTKTLLEFLENPQDRLSFIHVAGTNGKGSTATFIGAVLAAGGKKVGRYVSPAVLDEGEKIQWLQAKEHHHINKEEFAGIISEIRAAVEKMKMQGDALPTEFEIETAAAFLAFEKWNCDVVVLEVGMGGRLDATNVIQNVVCSVITPIAMDHMKFLGNSLEEIAAEKAGIIKEGVPVFTFQKENTAEVVIREKAQEMSAPLRCVRKEEIRKIQADSAGSTFDFNAFQKIRISMTGGYQVENAALALACIQFLKEKYGITETAVRKGMERAKWPGRFEILQKNPLVVVDGAHNPAGISSFLESVDSYYKDLIPIGIMGVFADKEYDVMCRQISGRFEKIYTVTPPSQRGLPARELAVQLQKYGADAEACPEIKEAVSRALKQSRPGQTGIFVFGSLSLLKEVYHCFS